MKLTNSIILSLYCCCKWNRWAAIASYLPQRTDNDIKNYWNTYLKKKLSKSQGHGAGTDNVNNFNGFYMDSSSSASKGQWERALQTDINMAKAALGKALCPDQSPTSNTASTFPPTSTLTASFTQAVPHVQTSSSTHASSAENIAWLLQDWTRKSPNSLSSTLGCGRILSDFSTSHDHYYTRKSPNSLSLNLGCEKISSVFSTSHDHYSNSINHNNNYLLVGSTSGSPRERWISECDEASGGSGMESLSNKLTSSINYSSSHLATESDDSNGMFLFQDYDETKTNVANNNTQYNHQQVHEQMSPFALLEKWLFDDVTFTSAAPRDDSVMNMF